MRDTFSIRSSELQRGVWTIQRKDVDSFFGSRFEADFTKLRYRDALHEQNVLGSQSLRRELRPRLIVGDREVDFFIPQDEIPERYTVLHSEDDLLPSMIGLKLHPKELEEALEADWCIELEMDLRVSTFVSLLKAAHLTQFLLFGYKYILSPAGHLVGHQLLGKLFEHSKKGSRLEAQEFAKVHLSDCINMVRPLLSTRLGIRGSVLDRQILVAWSASGFPWATIIIVPAGETLHGVMLPVGDHAEGIVTWHDFMNNENGSIVVKLGRFETAVGGGLWKLSKNSWRIDWPKGASFANITSP